MLELWGKTGYGEDNEVGGVEQWSLSWVNRIQGVVAVKLKGMSLICSRVEDCSRAIEFHWSWRQDPAEVLLPTCLICKKFEQLRYLSFLIQLLFYIYWLLNSL